MALIARINLIVRFKRFSLQELSKVISNVRKYASLTEIILLLTEETNKLLPMGNAIVWS